MPHTWDASSVPPSEAIQRLRTGNLRFRQSRFSSRVWSRELATRAQRPFAIVLGCSDSRTPVEILFNQGFGDLFVVRIAGNIVSPLVLGSIEFAASEFGTRLVVVMGHTHCGAVTAAVRAMTHDHAGSTNISAITDRVARNLAGMVRPPDDADLVRDAVRANVRAVADQVRDGSVLLQELIAAQHIEVVGAVYELETGMIQFLDAPLDKARVVDGAMHRVPRAASPQNGRR